LRPRRASRVKSVRPRRASRKLTQGPVSNVGEGVGCLVILCGPVFAWIIQAQNYWVMQEFKRVQAGYL